MPRSTVRIAGRVALVGLIAVFSAQSVAATPFGAIATAAAGAICTADGYVDKRDDQPFDAAAEVGQGSSVVEGCGLPNASAGDIWVASGSATASLITGHLQASGVAFGYDQDPTIPPGFAAVTGVGTSRIFDRITINGPSPVFSITAGLRLEVEGTMEGYAAIYATVGLFPSSAFRNGLAVDRGVGFTYLIPATGQVAFELALDVPVSSLDPFLSLYAALSASGVNDGTANVLGSAQLRIELPPGFTFTSDSGVLLTEAAGPISEVPEPTTGLLVATGAAAAAIRRRARRTVARRPQH